jgi:D-alanyl-D-alanine carboxypeptidase
MRRRSEERRGVSPSATPSALVAAVMVVTAVLVTSCQSSSTVSGGSVPTSTSGRGGSLTNASGLEASLQEVVQKTTVPSAIVLVRSGRFGDASYTFGNKQLGGNQPVRTTDHIRAGSVTKTMTATLILQLAQEGRLALEDPVSAYVSGVPDGDAITIAQLLDMRSGLYNYADDPLWSRAVDAEPHRVWRPRDLLDIAFAHPAYFRPGSNFHYTNSAYILLGMIMEQLTGQTASELFAQRLFAPLGMKDTTLPTLDDSSIPMPFAHGYHYGSFSSPLPVEQQAQAKAGTLRPQDVSDINPSWGWTAGSVISTAEDLVLWARALVGGSLLNPATQQRRLDSIRGLGPDYPKAEGVYGYGFGIDRTGSYLGHGGQINGYNTAMSRDPQTDTTIIVVATLTLAPDGTPVAPALANTVMAALTADRTATRTSSGPPGELTPDETSRP